jgi:hypothetical protein
MRALVTAAVLLVATAACSSSQSSDAFCDTLHRLEQVELNSPVSVSVNSAEGGDPGRLEEALRAAEAKVRRDVDTGYDLLGRLAATAPADIRADATTATNASRRYLAWIRSHDYDLFEAVTAGTWITADDAATARDAAARLDTRTRADCNGRFHLLPADSPEGSATGSTRPPPMTPPTPPAPPAPPPAPRPPGH